MREVTVVIKCDLCMQPVDEEKVITIPASLRNENVVLDVCSPECQQAFERVFDQATRVRPARKRGSEDSKPRKEYRRACPFCEKEYFTPGGFYSHMKKHKT